MHFAYWACFIENPFKVAILSLHDFQFYKIPPLPSNAKLNFKKNIILRGISYLGGICRYPINILQPRTEIFQLRYSAPVKKLRNGLNISQKRNSTFLARLEFCKKNECTLLKKIYIVPPLLLEWVYYRVIF